jgi:TetR/AcrR family transcriptional repressor of nem operon
VSSLLTLGRRAQSAYTRHMRTGTVQERTLTPKGAATRLRIVNVAADLMYLHGVQGTGNDDVRRVAGVSGSQLAHYFKDKESLVRAVLQYHADSLLGLNRQPQLGELDSITALREWAGSYIENASVAEGGCRFGSLSAEVIKSDIGLRGDVVAGFDRWEDLFLRGLRAMVERGDLAAGTDVQKLACVLMAAFQGGMLLAQIRSSTEPLRASLESAITFVESFAPATA